MRRQKQQKKKNRKQKQGTHFKNKNKCFKYPVESHTEVQQCGTDWLHDAYRKADFNIMTWVG